MKIIKELNERGNTIILITHDINVANQAKRTVKIMDGKIYE
jgi:putative ABC transport system ATP-binding protein